MTPAEQAALLHQIGLTERDMQRARDMVDEAVRVAAGPPGPIVTTLIDLEAEARVFCHAPGREPPCDAAYIRTRHRWRSYAAALTNTDRRDRKKLLGASPAP